MQEDWFFCFTVDGEESPPSLAPPCPTATTAVLLGAPLSRVSSHTDFECLKDLVSQVLKPSVKIKKKIDLNINVGLIMLNKANISLNSKSHIQQMSLTQKNHIRMTMLKIS